jgi:hypothetical protein
MNDDIKRQLEEASKKYAQKMEEAKHTETEKRQLQDESFKQFLEKSKPIILDALNEIGEYLKNQGHNYKISLNDKTVDKMGEVLGASITYDILPNFDKSVVTENQDKHPSITYSYSVRSKKVHTRVLEYMPGSGSGSSGPDTEIELADITKDVVQERVARLVTENFEKWRHYSF